MRLSFVLVCLVVGLSPRPATFAQTTAGGAAACPEVDEDVNLAVLDFVQLQAMSGLVRSGRDPHLYWTHNHSGAAPRIHALRDDGRWMGVAALTDATHADWEDIAYHDGHLYIGDIGDDALQRRTVRIYRVAEPVLTGDGLASPVRQVEQSPTVVEVAQTHMDVRLPGGPVDLRTLLVDRDGSVYLASHEYGASRVFRVGAFRAGGTVDATLLATLPLAFATGGDVAEDGRILLRSRDQAWLFPRTGGQSFADALTRHCPVMTRAERKGEAIACDQAGRHYFTVSEGRSPRHRVRLRP